MGPDAYGGKDEGYFENGKKIGGKVKTGLFQNKKPGAFKYLESKTKKIMAG